MATGMRPDNVAVYNHALGSWETVSGDAGEITVEDRTQQFGGLLRRPVLNYADEDMSYVRKPEFTIRVAGHALEPLRKAALALAKPLLWRCPYCGRSNRADQRFCGQGTVHGCGGPALVI